MEGATRALSGWVAICQSEAVTAFIARSAHATLLRAPARVVQLDCYEKMVNSFIHAVYSRPTATQMRSLIEWYGPSPRPPSHQATATQSMQKQHALHLGPTFQ